MNDKKNDLKNFIPKVLSKEEIIKLLEEGREAAKDFLKPKLPGDYEISFGKRAKILEHTCVYCQSKIEAIFELPKTNTTNYAWELTKHRCSKCKLVYDL
jgi:hypothetical protein